METVLVRMSKTLKRWLQREAVKIAREKDSGIVSTSAAAVVHLEAAKADQTWRRKVRA